MVFRTGSVDGWKLGVAIKEELNLSFPRQPALWTPQARYVPTYCPPPFDTIRDHARSFDGNEPGT